MNYAQITDLEARVGVTEVGQLSRLSGDAKTAYLTDILNGAEGMINGYAKKLWSIPLPASYATKEWTLAIATVELFKKGLDNVIPEKYQKAYEEAMKQIVDMNQGLFEPPADADGNDAVSARTAGSSISLSSDTPLFDEASMRGYF